MRLDQKNKTNGIAVRLFMLTVVAGCAYVYALWCFNDSIQQAKKIVSGTFSRPYVYRTLIPWLANFLNKIGFRENIALTMTIILSAIGLVYAIQYLLSSFTEASDHTFMVSALAALVFMILFSRYAKVYDISTAIFFALGISFMARDNLRAYYIVFTLSCLNRETTILLTLIFIFYFLGKLNIAQFVFGIGFQISTLVLVRILVMEMFKDNVGVDGVIRLSENLKMYTYYPSLTFIHWAIFALILWRIILNWKGIPKLLRLSFSLIFPVLTTVYLVAGFSFEVRVFAEVYPIATAILWLPKEKTTNSKLAILERE